MAYITDKNGNYKRSVRCSYCYHSGHSRRACPERFPDGTEAQQKAKAREEAKAQRKLEREQRKLDKAAGKKVTKIDRKCGYCKEYGHMRRKCEVLANDKTRLLDQVIEYRTLLRDEIVNKGIGQGALLAYSVSEYDYDKHENVTRRHYMMVTDTDLESANPHSNWEIGKRGFYNSGDDPKPLSTLALSGARQDIGRYHDYRMISDTDEEGTFGHLAYNRFFQTSSNKFEIVVPGEVSIPENFLNRETIDQEVETYFKTNKTRAHYNVVTRMDAIEAEKEFVKE